RRHLAFIAEEQPPAGWWCRWFCPCGNRANRRVHAPPCGRTFRLGNDHPTRLIERPAEVFSQVEVHDQVPSVAVLVSRPPAYQLPIICISCPVCHVPFLRWFGYKITICLLKEKILWTK